jgi:hypothetical protein
MQCFSGKEFNEKHFGKTFVKLADSKDKDGDGLVVRDGINVYTNSLNLLNNKIGIQFVEINDIPKWIITNKTIMTSIRETIIPRDANVFSDTDGKLFTDKLILSLKKDVKELEIWKNENFCLEAVTKHDFILPYLPLQTDTICLACVKSNGMMLQHVINKSFDICLVAVKQNGLAIQFVPETMSNDEIYKLSLEAVSQNGHSLYEVKILLEKINNHLSTHISKIYLAAVKENGYALEYVNYNQKFNIDLIEEIYFEAVAQNGYALQFVKPIESIFEICMLAVKQNPFVLKYMENFKDSLTDNDILQVCKESFKKDANALYYVKNKTPQICLIAVSYDGRAIQYIEDQTEEICIAAVKQTNYALQFIKNKTPFLEEFAKQHIKQ